MNTRLGDITIGQMMEVYVIMALILLAGFGLYGLWRATLWLFADLAGKPPAKTHRR